ncbi:MAG: DNA polymerase III subunit delta [Syntrophomonas sp.]
MSKSDTYFIWGEDSFLIDKEINDIVNRLKEQNGEDPELVYVDGDEISPRELLETLQFSALFSLQRVVVIKKPGWLGKNKRKGARAAEIEKVLREYFQGGEQDQILILTSNENNSSNPLVKLLGKEATVINCKTAGSQYVGSWIKEEVAARNRSINPGAVNLLVRSGQDLYYLQNLIDKLCLLVEDRAINEIDVEEEVGNKEEIKVFKLTDALLSRKAKNSFQAYYQLLSQGEHPVFLLYMMVRQFMTLGKVKYYLEKGSSKQEITAETGLKEFAVRKMSDNARNFTWDEIQDLFKLFLQADIAFKSSGQDEKIIMETLIVEICSKK